MDVSGEKIKEPDAAADVKKLLEDIKLPSDKPDLVKK